MAMRHITPTNATSLADEVEKRVRSLFPFSLKHELNSFAHQVRFGNLCRFRASFANWRSCHQ